MAPPLACAVNAARLRCVQRLMSSHACRQRGGGGPAREADGSRRLQWGDTASPTFASTHAWNRNMTLLRLDTHRWKVKPAVRRRMLLLSRPSSQTRRGLYSDFGRRSTNTILCSCAGGGSIHRVARIGSRKPPEVASFGEAFTVSTKISIPLLVSDAQLWRT